MKNELERNERAYYDAKRLYDVFRENQKFIDPDFRELMMNKMVRLLTQLEDNIRESKRTALDWFIEVWKQNNRPHNMYVRLSPPVEVGDIFNAKYDAQISEYAKIHTLEYRVTIQFKAQDLQDWPDDDSIPKGEKDGT